MSTVTNGQLCGKYGGSIDYDEVVPVHCQVAEEAMQDGRFTLVVTANLDQLASNEAFGIDNVRVRWVEPPCECDAGYAKVAHCAREMRTGEATALAKLSQSTVDGLGLGFGARSALARASSLGTLTRP